jgi:hypothetical protein
VNPSTETSDPNPTNKSTARTIAWILIGLLVLTGTAGFAVARSASAGTAPQDAGQLVRANSRVLSQAPQEKVQLVEFLDFECRPCLAVHPVLDELRREHADTVTISTATSRSPATAIP